MIIPDDDIVRKGLSGKVGNKVYRQIKGKTVECKLPRTNPHKTALQKNRQSLFSLSVAYAKKANKNPRLKAFHSSHAKKNQNAYQAAISYFMRKELQKLQTTKCAVGKQHTTPPKPFSRHFENERPSSLNSFNCKTGYPAPIDPNLKISYYRLSPKLATLYLRHVVWRLDIRFPVHNPYPIPGPP